MVYQEIQGNLFSYSDDRFIVHCISADFALGKGIAKQIDNKFSVKYKLKSRYPNYLDFYRENGVVGDVILTDNVFNLVTKENYWDKPTYKSMEAALEKLSYICRKKNISRLVMPFIGCGLDKLKWYKVSNIIKTLFNDIDCDILVVYMTGV